MLIAKSKVIAGGFLLALGFGLVAFGGCKSSPTVVSETRAETSPQNIQLWIADKGIDLRFKAFEQAKDLLAVFELANHTTRPILFETYSFTDRVERANFCRFAAKQTDIVKEHTLSNCRYANNITLPEIGAGESLSLAVGKSDVTEALNLSSDAPEIATKIGFEVFVGPTRQKQIVWSDTIVFPKTISVRLK